MMNLMTQAAMMAGQAIETDEERVDRLEAVEQETGIDANTLYDVERDVRGLGRYRIDQLPPETRQQIQGLAEQAAPMVGVPADQMEDLACVLVGQMLVDEPERAARIVYTLNEIFERDGLYAEADVDPPALDSLEDVSLDVDPEVVNPEPDGVL